MGLDAELEDLVEITVDAGHRGKVAELLAVVREIGAETERRGLTDENLSQLLDDR